MALNFVDRLLTIAVTATLTSAAWIVAGSGSTIRSTPAPSPTPSRSSPPAAPAHVSPTGAPAVALLIPVAGVSAEQLTDTFADERGGGQRLHEALDIMAPEGTPVLAAAEGTVEKLFLSAAGGKTIYVRSPDGETLFYYAHLQAYAPGLAEMQHVSQGQQLGTVGSTGNASPDAPHLHFAVMRTTKEAEWWDPATAVNPYPLLKESNHLDR